MGWRSTKISGLCGKTTNVEFNCRPEGFIPWLINLQLIALVDQVTARGVCILVL